MVPLTWERDEDKEFGKTLWPVLSFLREFLTMDVSKIVKICTLNLMNFFKHTLMQFRIAEIILLQGVFRKPFAQKLSCENTYR